MHLVAAMLILAVLPQDGNKKYTDFKDGTKWVYDKTEDGETGRIELKAIGKVDGKQQIESLEFKAGADKPTKTETLIWWVDQDGSVCWGEKKGDATKKMFTLLPKDPKKGSTWKGMGGDDSPIELRATYKGTQKITVPAGQFDAEFVEMTMAQEGMSFTINVWLLAGKGILKFEGIMDDGSGKKKTFLLVLKTFTAAN